MGLDTTHNAWHGSYSSFSHWRVATAALLGFDLHSMVGFGGKRSWSDLVPDPLHKLLDHSDCDGEISPEDCAAIAKRLEELIPNYTVDWHRGAAHQFADGCRDAAAAGEALKFH